MDKITRRVALGAATGLAAIGIGALAVPSGASAGGAEHASAVLRDANGAEVGWAELTEDATGRLHVNVKVEGLSPGLHGAHFHAVGSCSPTFAAAGGHHNPSGATHGSHNGDLPNLTVNGAGRGRLNATTDHATISPGPTTLFDVNGSALIIHADFDDGVTDPTGNSGARIACGVITSG